MSRPVTGVALAAVVATTPACTGDAGPCETETGAWGDEMPDLVMMAGDTVETSLMDHFAPRECLEGFLADYGDKIFAARSSDPAAVAVCIRGAFSRSPPSPRRTPCS